MNRWTPFHGLCLSFTCVVLACQPPHVDHAAAPQAASQPPALPPTRTRSAETPFSLEQATRGLVGAGNLLAELHTSAGQIDCDLWPEKAPATVANFVGLARGLRAWKSSSGWVTRPFFNDTTFHRVVPGFVIQAGARLDEGIDSAGYTLPDEVWPGATHTQAGLLCMANDGPNTGSSQFFILATNDASQLDGSYTIFGKCLQTELVNDISRVKAYGERPAEPVHLRRVVIRYAPRWE